MTDTDQHNDQKQHAEPLSRRGMLRYGALAAAAAAGTAGAAVIATPAQAAPGDPIKIDDVNNVGAAKTELSGSSLVVTASNAPPEGDLGGAAVLGRPANGTTSGVGVAGLGAGSTGAGVWAGNGSGPALIIDGYGGTFPPTSGRWKVGSIVSTEFGLFECVGSDNAANSQTVWAHLANHGVELQLLTAPVRVYASTKDDSRGRAKIARNQFRRISVLERADGSDISGVPPWATSVLATVQLESTETNTGYLAIASGDVAQPGGFSTTVWSTAGFAGVTSFTSALGQADATLGTITVACYSGNALAKTHFYIDIVGYYADTYVFGGPNAPALAKDGKLAGRLTQSRKRARK